MEHALAAVETLPRDEALGEESGPGTGFLAEVAVEWEEATAAAAARGIRVIHMRTGLVLAGRGGALEPMRRVFALGLGGPFGSGRQWMSWIALDDLTAVVAHCIARDDLRGAVNAVAPGAVTGRIPHWRNISCNTCRLVALSSTTRAARPHKRSTGASRV